MRKRFALVLAASTLSLAACADDLYGPYGYGGIGYGGVGYGEYGGYYAPYGYGPYYGAGYGAYDPFGWYGDYYYPGVGFYIYDSYRRPHRWGGDQERYWMSRRSHWQSRTGTTWNRENWNGFNRSASSTTSARHWHDYR